MAIFELAPALKNSKRVVKVQTNKVVLKLVPEVNFGGVVTNRTFGIILSSIFTLGLFALLVINTALAQDAFKLSELKIQAQNLKDDREAILKEVSKKSSPDQLAATATKLGMVPGTKPHFLDMSMGQP
jgi:hypothetical protein